MVFTKTLLRTTLHAYLFLLFPLLYYIFFYIYPLGYTGFLSFHRWEISTLESHFIGFKNYITFFTDPDGQRVLKTTFLFMAGIIPLRTVIALVLALLLNRQIWGKTFFRFAYFSPMVVSLVAASMVWLWIYEPQNGLANYFLSLVGLPGLRWLGDENLALFSLILMCTWKGMGYFMVIFLAGLQDIPQVLYEAAEIDGATKFKAFFYITLPLLSRVTTFVLVMSVIWDFRVFEPIYVLTGGGPLGQTEVITFYLYKQAFEYYQMGYASAVAYIGSAMVLIFTLIQWRLRKQY